jgi:hypothetical protein
LLNNLAIRTKRSNRVVLRRAALFFLKEFCRYGIIRLAWDDQAII